jgi:hypothetical protein
VTSMPDYIPVQNAITHATLRVDRSKADPEWIDLAIADGSGAGNNYRVVTTLTQPQLDRFIKTLMSLQVGSWRRDSNG